MHIKKSTFIQPRVQWTMVDEEQVYHLHNHYLSSYDYKGCENQMLDNACAACLKIWPILVPAACWRATASCLRCEHVSGLR